MKKWPLISIITPSFNQSGYIRKTINSILSQNYPNLEYIVMDGGSTDGTVEILKSYGKRIKWVSEKDKGQSDAINKGMKMAKGDILAYLNSDDLYKEGSLFAVAEYFLKNFQSYWLCGKCDIIDERESVTDNFVTNYKNIFLKHFSNIFLLSVLNYISQPAVFWRKEVTGKIGLFNPDLHYAMDYDYWLRTYKIYKSGYIDRYLASYRIHSQSKSGANFSALLSEGYQVSKSHFGRLLSGLHGIHDFITLTGYKIIRKNL